MTTETAQSMNLGHSKRPPKHVTRFYGNVDYALDVIANRQITLTHVSTLNDPFDPYFFLETDFGENRGQLLKHIEKHHPKDLGWFKKHVTAQSWQQAIKDLKVKMDSWRDGFFIFSTSGESDSVHPKDNLYMWGHYGNGHRGVAIEFDSQALTASVLKHHESIPGAALEADEFWTKIEYQKTFPPITAEDYYEFMKPKQTPYSQKSQANTKLEEYYNLMGRVKSEVWQRENEWRLMWHNTETRMRIYRCPINSLSITSIFLGLNQQGTSQRDFITEAKQNFPNAKILRTKRRPGDFALDFELVA